MNDATQLQFYFTFIAAACLTVAATHIYLKQKLGSRHDNSLAWLAAGLFIWLTVIWIEGRMLLIREQLEQLNASSLPDQVRIKDLENQLEFPAVFRRILSILNSVFLILFLSYFREGWQWLNARIKKLAATPEKTALGLLVVCIGAAVIDKTRWLYTETAMSVLVALLLFTGFSLTFWRRRIWLMLPVALGGGILLVMNQLTLLSQELPQGSWMANLSQPGESMIFRRILAVFILMLNTGALALTWLGENSAPAHATTLSGALAIPENGAQGDPAATEAPASNRLEFREEQGRVVVYVSFSKNGRSVRDVPFNDRELNIAKRRLLFLHAAATKENRSVKSSGFNNFSKERGDLIRELNNKLQALGLEILPDDLFAKGSETGTYRLTISRENIVIDEAARRLL